MSACPSFEGQALFRCFRTPFAVTDTFTRRCGVRRLFLIQNPLIRFAEIVFAYVEGTPKVKQVYKLS